MPSAVLKGFEHGCERDVKRVIDLFAMGRAQGKVTGITRGCGTVPFGVEGFAEVEWITFTNVMDAIVSAGVEDEFAGVTDVILTEKRALGALGAFDRRGDAPI